MSVVVFIGTDIPEKNIERIDRYKAYLSEAQKEEILSQINDNLEGCQISMHVEIEIKRMKK